MTRARFTASLFSLALLTACADQSAAPSPTVSVEPSSSPSARSSPTPAESPSEAPSPTEAAVGEWTEVPLGIEAGSEQLTGDQIVYGTAGFLAVGTRYGFTEGGPFPAQRYLWHSPDGRAWSGLPFPTEFGEVFLEALSTAANGDYTMYLSRTVDGGPEAELLGLRSADGESWEEFDHGLPGSLFVQAIEAGPEEYLLVGGQTSETNPTLWLSDDALTWEQVYEFDQSEFFVQLDDADGGDEGYVVLGRRIEGDSGAYRRFPFASADGRDWVNADEPFRARRPGLRL